MRALLVAFLLLSLPAAAETWPTKPVTVIVPFPAGGTTDILARTVTTRMGAALGAHFVIDNRGGAGGTIGAGMVARAKPDGYTLVMSNIASFAVAPTLYGNLPYDAVRDFTHIGLIAGIPSVLVVGLQTDIRTLADYVAAAKKDPGGIHFATSGNGSSAHIQGEMFKHLAGINIVHVPYRGSGPALIDVVGGQIASLLTVAVNADTMQPQVRMLAITTPDRVPGLPDVPTFRELGYPDMVADTWFGLSAPAGLDREITRQLNRALIDALHEPEVAKRFAEFAVSPNRLSPEEYARYVADELERWKPLIQSSGAQPN
jgi:tripartite-type tricarboxylate transporter receptor subunit TctC